jgi:hypothetical protein
MIAACTIAPRLGFADRGELLRYVVDGLHGSWFKAAVLDFEPVHGYRRPAWYTIEYARLLANVEGVLAESFTTLHAVHLVLSYLAIFQFGLGFLGASCMLSISYLAPPLLHACMWAQQLQAGVYDRWVPLQHSNIRSTFTTFR